MTSPEGYAGYNYWYLLLNSMYICHFMYEFYASLRSGMIPLPAVASLGPVRLS